MAPGEGVDHYLVEVSRNATFTDSTQIWDKNGSWLNVGSLDQGTWYWRVASVSKEGYTSLWSPTYIFNKP